MPTTLAAVTAVDRVIPCTWPCDVALREGTVVHVRFLAAPDREALVRFHEGLSPLTQRRRFLAATPHLNSKLLEILFNLDGTDRVALVVEHAGQIVAVGRYSRASGSPVAEAAFVVDDAWQSRGIGALLLEHLVAIARHHGIERFTAVTQSENTAMLDVFRSGGFPVKVERDPIEPAITTVSFPIDPTPESVRNRDARDQTAAAASIRPILAPNSVAVIGASSHHVSAGTVIVRHLKAAGFAGPIYPVHPGAEPVEGLAGFANVSAIGSPVDLAVIAVPADAVIEAAASCGAAGVRSLVVVSAGFSEEGEAGRTRQRDLLQVARHFGMRLVGPNCLGIAVPALGLDALFADVELTPGSVALMSQSGAVGMAVLAAAGSRGIGISSFVSVGNKADVSGNDLLQYWESDDATRVIALYLESFGNPRNFARIAARVTRNKPIVAIKAGRSAGGARAAASHTAALASPDAVVDALFERAGVTRVHDVPELLDVAAAFSSLPLMRGRRVAIVGNAGGPEVLAADALEVERLTLATLADETIARIREHSPRFGSFSDPMDLTAAATPAQIGLALDAVSDDPNVDAVIVCHVTVRAGDAAALANRIAEAGQRSGKPIIGCFLSARAPQPAPNVGSGRPIVLMDFPERAVRALAHLAARSEWLARPAEELSPPHDSVRTRAQEITNVALAEHPEGTWLGPVEAAKLVLLCGVRVAMPVLVRDADAAVDAAAALGYPVVLKIADHDIQHKSDVGGVRLGLRNDFEVASAYHAIDCELGGHYGTTPVLVAPMAGPGVEMLVGARRDRAFGPVVVVGAGGRTTELWHDAITSLAPIGPSAANAALSLLRSSPLLDGFRGAPGADRAALTDAVVAIGALIDAVPEIAEITINPLMAHGQGVTAVDIKVRVAPRPETPEDGVRRLR